MEFIIMYTDYVNTPLGLIECKASELGITQVIFCGPQQSAINANSITENCKQQLSEYFAGERKTFDLPLDAKGTEFQHQVWACLVDIPLGDTVSYLDIAKKVNRPKGSQAVGGANGRNPISIIVPCHRVVGAKGALTGYAGGIERKLWLLKHEGVCLKNTQGHEILDIANVINSRQDKTQFLT